MAVPRSQIPLNREIVDARGRVTTPWAFWFQTLYQLAPPVGDGYVIDGSYSTYGQSTMFQGNDSAKGTPLNGYIYIAVDTGKIYTEQSGLWQVQVPAYSGDASSQPFSTTLVLEADQPNIQTLLNLTQISVSGNATIGNVIATGNFIGDGSQLSNLTGANVVGQVANALVAGTVYTANQPNITSVGTLTSLSVSGNANIGNIGTGLITATGNVNTSGNLNATERLFYKRTYGSFTSNVTQNTAGANALNYMTFNNTELANGISIANSSNITIERTGIYNIQFSAQITHPDNQPANVEIWLDKNGTAIANTNTRLTIAKDVAVVAAWNFVEQFSTANDYFRLGWASSEANAQITAIPSANSIANVAIPSVILTVTPVGA